jgi:hypothetical protein
MPALKDEMNAAWMAWVDRSNLPTRTAVGAVLTPGTLVEIHDLRREVDPEQQLRARCAQFLKKLKRGGARRVRLF